MASDLKEIDAETALDLLAVSHADDIIRDELNKKESKKRGK